jgi:hypothetical protein
VLSPQTPALNSAFAKLAVPYRMIP